MLRTIAYSQLDPATKAYLREVRHARGRGAPGVFEAGSAGYAGVSLLIGLVILVVFVWCGYSTNKAPWAMALLQTAGVMLGGWLILYAFRRWFAGPDRYAGKFVYFDPESVFVGKGEELQYARLDPDAEVEPAGDSGVSFRSADGSFTVPVSSRGTALLVADYYDALEHLRREGPTNWWDGVSPAELGAMARYMVVNERKPSNMSDVVLDIDSMPDEVRPARGRPSGVLRYLLILAVGGLVYAGFAFTNQPLHDAGAFAGVNKDSPDELRHYLADPHTHAHHDEAKQRLKELYATKHRELSGKPATDPEVRDAFLKLFDSLDGPETPAVSLSVVDRSANAAGGGDSLRTRLADGIGTEVGKGYIVFVLRPGDKPPAGAVPPGEPAPPEGENKPALMQLNYSNDTGLPVWTLEFRLTPNDEKPYATITRTVAEGNSILSEAVYTDVMRKMLGNAPVAPAQMPLNDW